MPFFKADHNRAMPSACSENEAWGLDRNNFTMLSESQWINDRNIKLMRAPSILWSEQQFSSHLHALNFIFLNPICTSWNVKISWPAKPYGLETYFTPIYTEEKLRRGIKNWTPLKQDIGILLAAKHDHASLTLEQWQMLQILQLTLLHSYK